MRLSWKTTGMQASGNIIRVQHRSSLIAVVVVIKDIKMTHKTQTIIWQSKVIAAECTVIKPINGTLCDNNRQHWILCIALLQLMTTPMMLCCELSLFASFFFIILLLHSLHCCYTVLWLPAPTFLSSRLRLCIQSLWLMQRPVGTSFHG